jgi:hypothetical protein
VAALNDESEPLDVSDHHVDDTVGVTDDLDVVVQGAVMERR